MSHSKKKKIRTGSLEPSGEMLWGPGFRGGTRSLGNGISLAFSGETLPQMPSVISTDPILFALIDSVCL